MIEALWFYLKLGFWHVIDKQGLDHLYFIVTLAIPLHLSKAKNYYCGLLYLLLVTPSLCLEIFIQKLNFPITGLNF